MTAEVISLRLVGGAVYTANQADDRLPAGRTAAGAAARPGRRCALVARRRERSGTKVEVTAFRL